MKIVLTIIVMIYGISLGISWLPTIKEAETRKNQTEEFYRYLLPTELPKSNSLYKF